MRHRLGVAADDPYGFAAADVIGYGDELKVGLDPVTIKTHRVAPGDYRWADPDPQWEHAGGFEWIIEERYNLDTRRDEWQVLLSWSDPLDSLVLSWGWDTLAALRRSWLCDVQNNQIIDPPFVAESFMSAFLAPENIEAAIQHACSNPQLQAILTADYIKLALES